MKPRCLSCWNKLDPGSDQCPTCRKSVARTTATYDGEPPKLGLEIGIATMMLLMAAGMIWLGFSLYDDFSALQREGGKRRIHWLFALAYLIFGPRGPAVLSWLTAIVPSIFFIVAIWQIMVKYAYWHSLPVDER